MRKVALISITVVAMLFNSCLAAFAGEELLYTVKPGDTLYGIGKKYGLDYHLIIKENDLRSVIIKVGLKLRVPVVKHNVHTVRQGENLYRLSRRYGTNLAVIRKVNDLKDTHIFPGMRLIIPDGGSAGGSAKVQPVFSGRTNFSKDDIYLLARLIHAEARGESLKGQIAVGAVIMNRLGSGSFPGNIRQIIFQKNNGVYQFTPVQDGQINLEPDRTSFYAAEMAIKGNDPTGGALFFYNPETSSDRWIRTLPVTKVIGNHVFAK